MAKKELLAEAKALGLEVTSKWKVDELTAAIAKAQRKAARAAATSEPRLTPAQESYAQGRELCECGRVANHVHN